MTCPRCGGPPGPRTGGCPGCRDVCLARHRGEVAPCGQPAVRPLYAELFPKSSVMVCQRHHDLFMEDAEREAAGVVQAFLARRSP